MLSLSDACLNLCNSINIYYPKIIKLNYKMEILKLKMNNFLNKSQRLFKKKAFKTGVPFFLFILGGSYGLQQFTQLRYKYTSKQLIKPEDVELMGIKMKQPSEVSLESEYEKIKQLDLDNWNNIRGPRPWEATEN